MRDSNTTQNMGRQYFASRLLKSNCPLAERNYNIIHIEALLRPMVVIANEIDDNMQL